MNRKRYSTSRNSRPLSAEGRQIPGRHRCHPRLVAAAVSCNGCTAARVAATVPRAFATHDARRDQLLGEMCHANETQLVQASAIVSRRPASPGPQQDTVVGRKADAICRLLRPCPGCSHAPRGGRRATTGGRLFPVSDRGEGRGKVEMESADAAE